MKRKPAFLDPNRAAEFEFARIAELLPLVGWRVALVERIPLAGIVSRCLPAERVIQVARWDGKLRLSPTEILENLKRHLTLTRGRSNPFPHPAALRRAGIAV